MKGKGKAAAPAPRAAPKASASKQVSRKPAREALPGYSDEEPSSDDDMHMGRGGAAGSDDDSEGVVEVNRLGGSGGDVDSDSDAAESKDPSRWDRVRDQELAKLEKQSKAWGRSRSAYYGSETAGADSFGATEEDEASARFEEREAQKLQREMAAQLDEDDFGLGEVVAAAKGKKQQQAASAAAAAGAAPAASKGKGGKPDSSSSATSSTTSSSASVSVPERLAQVIADSPELLGLLDDFRSRMTELRSEVAPLLSRAQRLDPALATTDGISFLQLKHQLLLAYCVNTSFYLLLKCEGKSVAAHPVIKRLVHIRTVLERLRPVEKQLKYQIDKLLQAGATADQAGVVDLESAAKQLDLLAFRPRLSNLMGAGAGSGAGSRSAMRDGDGDVDGDVDGDGGMLGLDAVAKQISKTKAGGKTSALAAAGSKRGRAAFEDDADVDIDGGVDGDVVGAAAGARARLMGAATFDSLERKPSKADRRAERERAKASSSRLVRELRAELSEKPSEETATGMEGPRMDTEDKERLEFEEDHYTRLLETKELQRKRRRQERASQRDDWEDFADLSALTDMEAKRDEKAAANRAILEQMRSRTAAKSGGGRILGDDGADGSDDDDDDGGMGIGGADYDEDDVAAYRSAAGSAAERREEKKARRKEAVYLAPRDESMSEGGKRYAGNKIIKNRGLVRSAPAHRANPRMKMRAKYDKAMSVRRSQVREFKGKEDGVKGAIKRGVIKSTKIH